MNIRSISIAGAVLLMSAGAGFAEDWPQSPFDRIQSPQGRAQNPQVQAESSQDPQDWTQNLYAHVDAGYLYQEDTTLNYSASSGTSTTSVNGTATFNPGFRGDAAFGYKINKLWAVEFDTGVLWNSMDQFNGNSLSSANQSFDTYTIPILANVIYKVPLKGPWVSYVGVGVGGAASILSYSASGYNFGDQTFVFGYQAKAGLQYNLTPNASIDLTYEFFGMTNPSWHFNQTIGITTTDYQFNESGFYTHSIVVSFTWNF
jgi:opacity protein-like surface antigen